jgi:hypothetical protein
MGVNSIRFTTTNQPFIKDAQPRVPFRIAGRDWTQVAQPFLAVLVMAFMLESRLHQFTSSRVRLFAREESPPQRLALRAKQLVIGNYVSDRSSIRVLSRQFLISCRRPPSASRLQNQCTAVTYVDPPPSMAVHSQIPSAYSARPTISHSLCSRSLLRPPADRSNTP